MSRRRGLFRSRAARRRFNRRALAAVAGVGGFGWAWQTHPVALALALTAAAAWVAVRLYARRHRTVLRASDAYADMRPCGLYQHFFAEPAGHVYVGITNNYQARLAQHAAESWWFGYTDLRRSTWQVWTAADCPPGFTPRDMAKAAETAAILQYAPIGNTDENPLYRVQQPERLRLKAAIGWTDPATALTPRRTYALAGRRRTA